MFRERPGQPDVLLCSLHTGACGHTYMPTYNTHTSVKKATEKFENVKTLHFQSLSIKFLNLSIKKLKTNQRAALNTVIMKLLYVIKAALA